MTPQDYAKASFLNKAHEEAVRKLKRQGLSPEVSSDWNELLREEYKQIRKEADKRFGAFRQPSKEDVERWKKFKI